MLQSKFAMLTFYILLPVMF